MRHFLAVATLGATLALATTVAFADDNTNRPFANQKGRSVVELTVAAGLSMTDFSGQPLHQPSVEIRQDNRER